jgi:hypothetical protein
MEWYILVSSGSGQGPVGRGGGGSCEHVNPLKTEFLPIHKNSVRTSQETRYISAKGPTGECCLGEQPLFIVRTTPNTQVHCVGRMQSFSLLKQVVRVLTTRL